MNSLLDIDQLRTFLAIVETGSFTRAAEIVHKTQSAVSMQMKRLEERLERPIFASDTSGDPREDQANAFAAQLLTLQWLIVHHMKRQGWRRDTLNDPVRA